MAPGWAPAQLPGLSRRRVARRTSADFLLLMLAERYPSSSGRPVVVAERLAASDRNDALADEAQRVEDEPGGDEQCEQDGGEDADVAQVALDVVVLGALAIGQARAPTGIGACRRR